MRERKKRIGGTGMKWYAIGKTLTPLDRAPESGAAVVLLNSDELVHETALPGLEAVLHHTPSARDAHICKAEVRSNCLSGTLALPRGRRDGTRLCCGYLVTKDRVVLVDDCVDIFNPKVIRSTAGSLFHLPVVSMGTDEYFDWCAERGLAVYAADVYGTDARPPEPLTDVLAVPQSLAQAKTVLFGNEARGLTQDVLERVDRIVSIPIYGKAESLNLGTSAAVMLLSLAMSSHVERM